MIKIPTGATSSNIFKGFAVSNLKVNTATMFKSSQPGDSKIMK